MQTFVILIQISGDVLKASWEQYMLAKLVSLHS